MSIIDTILGRKKKVRLSEEDKDELERIKREAYMERAEELVKQQGRDRAEEDYK